MTVNLNQYRWTVGVFNKLPLKKTHGPSLQKNNLKTHLIEIVIFLIVLSIRYIISLSSAQNIRFLHRSLFHSSYFMSVLSYIHHVWLYSLVIKLSGDIERTQIQRLILVTVCLFVIGTYTASVHTTS